MSIHEPITKLTQIIQRDDGSEVRLVGQAFYGIGMHRSIGVDVFRRDNPEHPWIYCSNQPHPDWRNMPLKEYAQRGRAEQFRWVSHGEIMRVIADMDKPLSYFQQNDYAS